MSQLLYTLHVTYLFDDVVFIFSQEYFGPERKGRISLDVDIEGPVLLIPKHAFSPDLMVGDIGHVKVTNSTRFHLYSILNNLLHIILDVP